MTCPKCGNQQDSADACGRCGLAAEFFDSYQPEPPGEEMSAKWSAVESAWDDPQAHETFLSSAMNSREFAFAARCYRERLPVDASAKDYLDRIEKMALVAMASTAAPRAEEVSSPYRNTLWVLGFLVFLAVAAVLYVSIRPRPVGPAPTPLQDKAVYRPTKPTAAPPLTKRKGVAPPSKRPPKRPPSMPQ